MKGIMRVAHRIAKQIAPRTGSYQVAFSFALREVWSLVKQIKKMDAKEQAGYLDDKNRIINGEYFYRAGLVELAPKEAFGVPAWIIKKDNASSAAHEILYTATSMSVLRETERAKQVEFDTASGKYGMWVPKSVIK